MNCSFFVKNHWIDQAQINDHFEIIIFIHLFKFYLTQPFINENIVTTVNYQEMMFY